ncbi:OmpH family outer membrane protein [Flavobacteriaceae bacterium XHP0103]|uniref:OmpH family outer membrane protein n=1 Tax=Marixanthotalea marina TaxID=2844359 RepID=UPI002989AAC9|nr:OmpH family outer membrane protein [Marixanthotalea marina]MBU3820630.1 OmpH family outer membrane protein [Marixanthotalea marina]
MRKIGYLIIGALILTACQEQLKIGYVDNGELVNEYQKKKDLEAKFQVKEQAFIKKFDSIDAAFQVEAQKFQTEAPRMAQTTAQEKYQQLTGQKQMIDQQKQVEAQQFQQEFQTEIDTIIVNIKEFVKDYGKKNGYNFVLGTSEGASSVLYGQESSNLTEEILKALNDTYKK